MSALTIAPNETGKIRVFSLSMSDAEAFALDPTQGGSAPNSVSRSLARVLGTDTVDANYVEVFKVSDLADLGLAGYLLEGNGAKREAIDRDRARLAALDGWVMLVYSGAFSGDARTLDPLAELTLIGTYEEQMPDSTPVEIASEAARPYTGTPTLTPPTPPRGTPGSAMIVLGLIVIVALLIWWIFT